MNLITHYCLSLWCLVSYLGAEAGTPADEPIAQCCHYAANGMILEVCDNSTEAQCKAASPDGLTQWVFGQLCGSGGPTNCPALGCVGNEGSCFEAHSTPGCCDPWCCTHVCASHGSSGAFCCNVAWDDACVAFASYSCAIIPANDTCIPYPDYACESGALLISVPGTRTGSNTATTTSVEEPGFCCHSGLSAICVGGVHDGLACTHEWDCYLGTCQPVPPGPRPGQKGSGTMWFKFVQGSGTTAGIHTCLSNSPALDSLLQVFAVGDGSSPEAACNSLIPIACNDDAPNCGSLNANSRLCLRGLTPGDTYYVMVAAKTPDRQAQYTLTVSTSCTFTGVDYACPHCPSGKFTFIDPPNGVVDARRPFPQNHPELPEGIQNVRVAGPQGAAADCWTACESPVITADLAIIDVEEEPYGAYAIHLSRPIGPGSVTTITYTDDDAITTIGRFASHPANVNADSISFPTDILDLVDHLNGVRLLPWGVYSGDLDRSGVIAPADILTLIDLLMGTNGYGQWNGTPLPDGSGCP